LTVECRYYRRCAQDGILISAHLFRTSAVQCGTHTRVFCRTRRRAGPLAIPTCVFTGFLWSGKVREFLVSQGKSGKTERVREKSGNFKIQLTRPIIYALFSQFSPTSGGFAPRLPSGLRARHCRLVLYCNILQWNKV